MRNIKFTSKKIYNTLFIYINGQLHCQINTAQLVGLQNYIRHKDLFIVELYFKQTNPVFLEYDNRYKWEQICKILDENILFF